MVNEADFLAGVPLLTSKPTWLQVEPTTLCNIHCVMCREQEHNRNWGQLAVPELFSAVYETGILDYLELLEINGWGETFLHPKIGWFLEKCTEFENFRVQITTNGLLLNNDYILDKLCRIRHMTLRFSVDSADPIIYERIRRGASWKSLTGNIRALNQKKKRLNSSLVQACDCLVNQGNINALIDMVDFALEYEFDYLCFMRVHNCPELEVSNDAALFAMEKAKNYAENKPIVVSTYERIKAREEVSQVDHTGMVWRCPRPWKHAMIGMNGNVFPCCFLANPRCRAVMGNITTESFTSIWNSEKYARLRMSAYAGYPTFCSAAIGCSAKTKFIPNVLMK
jgi:radical SAM protein with 4Fe4S-binding SPASM domain